MTPSTPDESRPNKSSWWVVSDWIRCSPIQCDDDPDKAAQHDLSGGVEKEKSVQAEQPDEWWRQCQPLGGLLNEHHKEAAEDYGIEDPAEGSHGV